MPSNALEDCGCGRLYARGRIAVSACDPAILFSLIGRAIMREELFLVIIDRVVSVLQDVPSQHGHHVRIWSNESIGD